jgi:uncharacterized phiE125 gp8 family phage protein
LAEFKAHCRIEFDTEDTHLGVLLSAAEAYVAKLTNRALPSRTFTAVFNGFCGRELFIPRPPLVSIQGVDVVLADGTTQTVLPADLDIDAASQWARVRPAAGADWPTPDLGATKPVSVRFTAGYAALPADLKMAVLLVASHWYEVRAPVVVGAVVSPVPFSLQALIDTLSIPEAV